VFDFIDFMYAKFARQALATKHETALLSEQALAADWNRPEEDNAWSSFQ